MVTKKINVKMAYYSVEFPQFIFSARNISFANVSQLHTMLSDFTIHFFEIILTKCCFV